MIRENKVLSSKHGTRCSSSASGHSLSGSLERIVREASANREHDKIAKIVDQLCHDYAYAVHQPHARNGGLIGLAAASIALGSVMRIQNPMYRVDADGSVGGSRSIPQGDSSSGAGLFHRSRCTRAILRMRKHVQHR